MLRFVKAYKRLPGFLEKAGKVMIKANLGVLLAALMLGGCVYDRQQASREAVPPPAPEFRRAPTQIIATAPQPDRIRESDLARLSPGTGVAGPEAEPMPLARRTPHPSRLFVQAASFITREEAERSRRALTGIGRAGIYTAYVDNQLRYRVRIGPLATPERTERVRDAVVRRGYSDAIIVHD
jgi:cell division protein FtsN